MSEAARKPDAAVRLATQADAVPLSQTLARAFHDDPVMMHFIPDEAVRRAKLPRVFRLMFKLGLPHDSSFVTGNYESVTFWRPPNGWHVPFWQYIVNGPELLGIFGTGALHVMNTMDKMEKIHPREPHWYLQVIGTEPSLQGKGFGSRIMRNQLAVADEADMHCYLETSKDTNIPIYRSFGFEVTGEIQVPDGPTIWPMWRKARRFRQG